MDTTTIRSTVYEVACPLCGQPCDLRLARTGNPYFTCPDCGLRCFINSPMGKERLSTMVTMKGESYAV